jgi:hypothetical protein
MSSSIQELGEEFGLDEQQKAFIGKYLIKAWRSAGKLENRQKVVDYKTFLNRRAALIDVMKGLPVDSPTKINFGARVGAADAAKETGQFAPAIAQIEGLIDDAKDLRRDCVAELGALTKRLTGLAEPEGIEDGIVQAGRRLRAQATDALRTATDHRFAFGTAKIAMTALENLYKSAPKLAALQARSAGVADETRLVLGRLDTIIAADLSTPDAREKATRGRQLLVDTINHGPLSGETGRPIDDESAKSIIRAFERDPDLADVAARKAATAKYPAAVAKGLDLVITQVEAGFPNRERVPMPKDQARSHGKALLDMGGKLGDGYFDLLPEYLASGHQSDADPMGSASGKTPAQVMQERGLKLAQGLMKPGGEIDLTSDAAKAAIGNTLFHPDAISVATPEFNAHVLETLKVLKDPKASEVLKSVTAPVTPGGLSLVRKALGKGGEDPIDDDAARSSVLSAMLKPLQQGKVGSCFATAPARRQREMQPLKAMQAYADIASTGQYQPPGGVKVPAVTNVPAGDDPLQRSWEFSLASSGARRENSKERETLSSELSASLRDVADFIPGSEVEKGEKMKKLTSDVKKAFEFEYDAMAKIASKDGSSATGHFVLSRDNTPITSSKDFSKHLTATVMTSLAIDPSSEQAEQVKDLVEFQTNVLAHHGTYKPWDLPAGSGDGATEALFGITTKLTPLGPTALGGTAGERTTQILTDFVKTFGKGEDSMVPLGVSGKHAFNGLPNHPSLAALKGDDAEAVGTQINRQLVEKGLALSRTDLSPERAGWMFDQQMADAIALESDHDLKIMLQGIAATKRPTTALKPKALVDAVNTALKPYLDTAGTGKKPAVSAGATTRGLKTRLMRDMGAPEFVVADTNWGDATQRQLFVIAPDPTTGQPQMWRKDDPDGTLAPLGDDWVEAPWCQFERVA